MTQRDIALRLLAKECLRRAFRESGARWYDGPTPPDTHGEFGLATDWPGNADRARVVERWLSSSAGVSEVVENVLHGVPEIDRQQCTQYIRQVLNARTTDCAANPELAGEGLAERLAEGGVLPMFGMPSRVRLLYHGVDGRNKEFYAIDRDLDLAVIEFAPGSQRTKDKRIHTSIGFTAALRFVHNRISAYRDNPLPNARWMLKCSRCYYVTTHDVEPAQAVCPNCGAIAPDCRTFRFAVPLGFRTNLDRGTDAKDEGEFIATGAGSSAESSVQPYQLVPSTNTMVALSLAGRVFRVNDNRGRLFEGARGVASSTQNGRNRADNQWIETRYQNQPDGGVTFVLQQPVEQIAIASPKTTALLRVRPARVPEGLTLDPLSRGASVKAAFYSGAFILRSYAAERLDIDPDELEISNIRQVETDLGSRVGEIVINDHLANGAGFTQWIEQNWRTLLQEIVSAEPGSETFAGSIRAAGHRRNCDSSCYDCLRKYRNMSYHGLLDWRLGLSLLAALADTGYACGLNGEFGAPELERWPEGAIMLRDMFCTAFGCARIEAGPLPAALVGNRTVIFKHPLWDHTRPRGLVAEAIAAVAQTNQYAFLDTFNVLRRPSHAYLSLLG